VYSAHGGGFGEDKSVLVGSLGNWIGVREEYPIATYAGDDTELPGYLEKWPYLRSETDLDIYARETQKLEIQFERRRYSVTEHQFRAQTTRSFHRTLKAALGER
jgi:hypothetical protein